MAACTGSACKNDVLYGAPSPDGALIAFVFHRQCGTSGSANATVGTHVSIVAFHDSLRDDAGNVLAVDGEQPVKVTWRGPTTLLVTGFSNPVAEHIHPIDTVTVEFR